MARAQGYVLTGGRSSRMGRDKARLPWRRSTLVEWVADGVCRCPDDCIVAPDAWCEHGLASWWLISKALDNIDQDAFRRGEDQS